MARRLTLVVSVAVLLVSGVLAPNLWRPGLSATAEGNPMATVLPASGSLQTTFLFSASGLTPGNAVDIALFDAVSNRYTYQKDGVDQSIVVDANGNASLSVTPGTDLSSPVPGPWQAIFQEEETGLTAVIPFDVSR